MCVYAIIYYHERIRLAGYTICVAAASGWRARDPNHACTHEIHPPPPTARRYMRVRWCIVLFKCLRYILFPSGKHDSLKITGKTTDRNIYRYYRLGPAAHVYRVRGHKAFQNTTICIEVYILDTGSVRLRPCTYNNYVAFENNVFRSFAYFVLSRPFIHELLYT